MIQGIGIVTCLYVNPKTHEYWDIDYRVFDKDPDGKTKIKHLLDMLHDAYSKKQLPFRIVLMDTWYASMQMMKAIDRLPKIYYVPLKRNRLVNDTGGVEPNKLSKIYLGLKQKSGVVNVYISKTSRRAP